MIKVVGRITEKALYEPTREFLRQAFLTNFGNCHLEITANGHFSEPLLKAVQQDIIFAFLKSGFSPDLTGFITRNPVIQEFITVEIKAEKITLKDIAQAKLYGDLFSARYAFLISPKPIPERIKRLHWKVGILSRLTSNLYILGRLTSNLCIFIGQLQFHIEDHPLEVTKANWFPESPFAVMGVTITPITLPKKLT